MNLVLTAIGTLAAIVAACAGVVLLIAQFGRWNAEDRPLVYAGELNVLPATNEYHWVFYNRGKEEATRVKIKIGLLDLSGEHHALLIEEVPRLKNGNSHPVDTIAANELEFVAVCLSYDNNGTHFDDLPKFYYTPFYNRPNSEIHSSPTPVEANQETKLSAVFLLR